MSKCQRLIQIKRIITYNASRNDRNLSNFVILLLTTSNQFDCVSWSLFSFTEDCFSNALLILKSRVKTADYREEMNARKFTMYVYIYIYIYLYVCVCVCLLITVTLFL
jgi:hypothetical protein